MSSLKSVKSYKPLMNLDMREVRSLHLEFMCNLLNFLSLVLTNQVFLEETTIFRGTRVVKRKKPGVSH